MLMTVKGVYCQLLFWSCPVHTATRTGKLLLHVGSEETETSGDSVAGLQGREVGQLGPLSHPAKWFLPGWASLPLLQGSHGDVKVLLQLRLYRLQDIHVRSPTPCQHQQVPRVGPSPATYREA